MAMPSDEGQRVAYLNWLRDKYCLVDHITALTGDTVSLINFPLDEIFVPQRVRKEPVPVKLPRELECRLLSDRKLLNRDLPDGEDRESLVRKLREYAEHPVRPVLEVIASREGERVVLLGYPGAGKSTLARYVALALAELAQPADGHNPAIACPEIEPIKGYLPFVAPLRTYAKPTEHQRFVDVISRLTGAGSEVPTLPVLETCLTDQRALVIFDGLDEVFDVELRDDAKERIRAFADFYPGVRAIVTSRATDYDRHEFDRGRGFAHHTLQDLDREEITIFARRFYRQVARNDQAEASQLTARLIDAVKRSPAVSELAGNPMLLTTFAFLGRGQDLPLNRLDALKRTVELLVEGWDFSRHLRKARGAREIEPVAGREKLELLRLVAQCILDGANGERVENHLPAEKLVEVFSKYFQHLFKVSEGDADSVAWRLLDQLRERDYILAKFETDAYGFMHRAILDYLAAADIFTQFSKHKIDIFDIVDRFRDHWREPAWQEVLPLLAGMLAESLDEEAAPAFLALLKSNPLWYQGSEPLPSHVLLTIRCLGEVRLLHPLRTVSQAVATALTSLLEAVSERTDYGAGMALAQALEEQVLPVLAGFGPGWAGRPLYENWYLTRGQFLRGERPGFAAAAASRIYIALLGRDDAARERLETLARWADPETVRAAALESLAANWHDDPAAVALLSASAIGDPDWYVRRVAVRALAAHHASDRAAHDLLVDRTRSDREQEPEVRRAAARALADGWRGNPDVAALLRTIGAGNAAGSGANGGDKDPNVRAAAVQALAEGWHDDKETLPWLWARTADGEHPLVRAAAVQALAAGWHDNPEVLPWLRAHAAQSSECQPAVRVAVVRALAAGWPEDQETVELLAAKAREDGEDDLDVRLAAVEALAVGFNDSDQTARQLRELAGDQDADIRYAVTEALAAYWPNDLDTGALVDLLSREEKEEDPFVRAAAVVARAGLRSGDQETGAWLRNLVGKDPAWYVRHTAVRAVAAGWHGAEDTETAAALVHAAEKDADADVRGAAVLALAAGWHGAEDTGMLDWLHTVGTGDRDALAGHVRQAATKAVAISWHDDPNTPSWLSKRAIDDERPEIRRTALQLFAAGWHDDPDTPGWLRQRAVGDLRDGSPEVRRAAIRTLSAGWHDDPDTAAWLRDHAFTDEDRSVRLAVIRTLASDWHDDPDTPGWLRDRAAADPDPEVGQAAAHAVDRGWLGIPG